MSNKTLVVVMVMAVSACGLFFAGYILNRSGEMPPAQQTSENINEVQPGTEISSAPIYQKQLKTPTQTQQKLTPKVWETQAGQLACNFLPSKNDLLQAIPPPPLGYENTTPSIVYSYEIPGETTAAAAYLKSTDGTNEAEKRIEVVVKSFCDDPSVMWNEDGIYRTSSSNMETTEAITISGNKTLKQHYRLSEDSYSYTILLGKHILVHVYGEDGTSDADVFSVANAVNYNKLNDLLAQWEF